MSRDYIGYVSLICRFIATQNYKSTQPLVARHTTLFASSSCFAGADPWSRWSVLYDSEPLDLGSVNAPPPLDHRDSGVGWSCGPLVLDVMRNRIALGIIPGETYREPQATSSKPHNLWLCG